MLRLRCARTASRRHARRRHLSAEPLESRTVLSNGSSLPDASLLPDQPTVEAGVDAFVQPTDQADEVSGKVGPSTPPPRQIRLTGLLVSPSADWLLKSRRQSTAVGPKTKRVVNPDTAAAIALILSTDRPFSVLNPSSKYCPVRMPRLCKVPLDSDVDPILKCPGVDAAFCLPQDSSSDEMVGPKLVSPEPRTP